MQEMLTERQRAAMTWAASRDGRGGVFARNRSEARVFVALRRRGLVWMDDGYPHASTWGLTGRGRAALAEADRAAGVER